MRFLIFYSFLFFCCVSANSYFVRWWNDNIPLSDKERRAWKRKGNKWS